MANPVVTIALPLAAASYDLGETVRLSGSATDAEDGVLTGALLVWTSNVDIAAPLGTGRVVDVTTLSVGAHTLTLTATDSALNTGTATVAVTINPAPVASLPTRADLKLYLRIQTPAQDALLGRLIAEATGLVTAYLGRPIVAVERTWEDAGTRLRGPWLHLMVPTTPFDPASLVVEDADGTELVITDEYRAPSQWNAVVRAAAGVPFSNGPYTLTADVGLSVSTAPDYATVIRPVVAQAILDVGADLYQRRSPAATSESTGGGVSTSYDTASGLPTRVCAALSPFAALRIV